ncbi:O-methyltransferase [Natronoflexus pectinivorans]|uniref:O-methyltransferase n=1 Tax=Natronoflexus pectinivorans TaxID=682526 RepID=UPI001FB8082D|nr:class I SAM-dependent methyltransferase [Natronoflexus pectinivorans]
MNWFQIKRHIPYLLAPNHWKGHGIHSPFVFDLVGNLMQEKHPYYCFVKINAWRHALLKSSHSIEVKDLGAGSSVTKRRKRRIADIAKNSSTPAKYGELMFRLVSKFKPGNILELGTSLGIGTLYLAMPDKSSKVITIEGCPKTAKIAQQTFDRMEASNVNIINGNIDDVLPETIQTLETLDFVYFDGNHKKEATLNYFHLCLEKINNNSIFVFDDIHWSKEMEEAWEDIIHHPKVTVSIDIFRMGLVFFRKENQKEHFKVRF